MPPVVRLDKHANGASIMGASVVVEKTLGDELGVAVDRLRRVGVQVQGQDQCNE